MCHIPPLVLHQSTLPPFQALLLQRSIIWTPATERLLTHSFTILKDSTIVQHYSSKMWDTIITGFIILLSNDINQRWNLSCIIPTLYPLLFTLIPDAFNSLDTWWDNRTLYVLPWERWKKSKEQDDQQQSDKNQLQQWWKIWRAKLGTNHPEEGLAMWLLRADKKGTYTTDSRLQCKI